ncbi:MAG: hypothetical protein H6742_12455 [Alphaproteobacteria bacterium]|nr:hypothetical protein [Alphaproteobacteria bacterium]
MTTPTLPPPERAAEDEFVQAQARRDDVDALVALITAAVDGKRPQLAARLVGLLDGRVEIEAGSALARAQSAARMLLIAREPVTVPEHPAFQDLDEAWRIARRGRMQRITQRMRDRSHADGPVSTGPSPRRRPRLTGRYRRG